MNLETFLKRIPVQLHPTSHHEEPRGRAEFVQPPELSHNERDYKTTNSIGTFGSSEVQDEHSMVESRFQGGSALPPFNTFEQPYQMRNSTLEDELNNIDKLKQMYESKINNGDHRRSRGAFRSIEKSSDGRSHSNEKHTLKPSNTPSFVKQYSSDENGCDSP
ncbi:MAG: hypothetical protein JST59_02465 [Actinobacteria bacterium]|nr:hypothetical protein [Actinomycetota bacterium]